MQTTITRMIELGFENEALVSELQQQGEALSVEAQRAESANAAKTRFLAIASHDLAQPMHALELFMSALRREANEDRRQRLIRDAGETTTMLSDMFSSLLDVSKLEAAVIAPELEDVDLQSVLRPLVADFRTKAGLKQLTLEISAQHHIMRTDPRLLRRILINLLGNAIAYTEQGSVSLVTQQQDEGGLLIGIVDTGLGIDPGLLEHIFAEHYQGRGSNGMGLGLYVVARLCELLGITIDVVSSPGVGSTFSLRFPPASCAEARSAEAVSTPVANAIAAAR